MLLSAHLRLVDSRTESTLALSTDLFLLAELEGLKSTLLFLLAIGSKFEGQSRPRMRIISQARMVMIGKICG